MVMAIGFRRSLLAAASRDSGVLVEAGRDSGLESRVRFLCPRHFHPTALVILLGLRPLSESPMTPITEASRFEVCTGYLSFIQVWTSALQCVATSVATFRLFI